MDQVCPTLEKTSIIPQLKNIDLFLKTYNKENERLTFRVPIDHQAGGGKGKRKTTKMAKQKQRMKKGGSPGDEESNGDCNVTLTTTIPDEFISLVKNDNKLREKFAKLLMVIGVVKKNYRYLLQDKEPKHKFRIAQLQLVIKDINNDKVSAISAEMEENDVVTLSVTKDTPLFDKLLCDLDEDCNTFIVTVRRDKVEAITQTSDWEGGMYEETFEIINGEVKMEEKPYYDPERVIQSRNALQSLFQPFAEYVAKIHNIMINMTEDPKQSEIDEVAKLINLSSPRQPGGARQKPITKAVRQHFSIPANLRVSEVPGWMAKTYSKAELTTLIGLPTEEARRSFARLTKEKMIAMILRR